MLQRFEMMRSSWFAEGRVTGLESPGEGAYFNQEELRWELGVEPEFFLAYLRDFCMKHNVSVKLVFPPYGHPETDLPIIEILDTEEQD